MSDITVSIVIPCYNAASSIEQTVASVLAQRHVHEVIIVDDGSSDDSVSIARSIVGRVDVVSGPNRGRAMRAIAVSRGHEALMFFFWTPTTPWSPGSSMAWRLWRAVTMSTS